jgi:hypothetical protein
MAVQREAPIKLSRQGWRLAERQVAKRHGVGTSATEDVARLVQSLYQHLTAASSTAFELRGHMGACAPEVAEALRAIEKARRIVIEVATDEPLAGARSTTSPIAHRVAQEKLDRR